MLTTVYIMQVYMRKNYQNTLYISDKFVQTGSGSSFRGKDDFVGEYL